MSSSLGHPLNRVDEPKQVNLSETFHKSLYPLLKMCLYPKKIRNSGFLRLGGMPYVTIPCGICRECQEVKTIDYYLRTMSIYKELFPDGKPSGWSVWFCTLTFSPEHLPYVNAWSSYDPDDPTANYEGCFPSFNHQLLKRFLKSFKQYFVRDLGLLCPHLLVTCEYGKEKHRPHYHMLAFIPKIYKHWSEFRDIMLRFWHYGFVKNVALKTIDGKTQDRHVCDSVKYVCKYACKGSSWFPDYVKNNWTTDIRPFDCRPRVFTTNGYGSQLEKLLQPSDYELGKFVFADLKKQRTYIIPQYLKRRYFVANDYHLVEKRKITSEGLAFIKKMPYFCEEKDTKTKYIYFNNSKHINNYDNIVRNRFAESLRVSLFKLKHDIYSKSWSWRNINNIYSHLDFSSFCKIIDSTDSLAFSSLITQLSFHPPVERLPNIKIPTPNYQYVNTQMFYDFLPLFQVLPIAEQNRQFREFHKWLNLPSHLSLRRAISNIFKSLPLSEEYLIVYCSLSFAEDYKYANRILLSDAKYQQDMLWLSNHCQKPDE